jgi:NAD+ synthase
MSIYKDNFNPTEEVRHICDWIKNYFVSNGPEAKAVIGISGGKDSTIAAALLCNALGPERVIAVLMPQGEQDDFEDALWVCDYLEINSRYTINIGDICEELYYKLHQNDLEANNRVFTNTPARIRMSVLYAVAAIVNGRVVNTCNRSEDFVGFSTKYGDLAGDFSLFKNYCVSEILQIGDCLGLPKDLVHKVPSDGMCGMSDEEKMGFTYQEVDNMLLYNELPEYEKYKKIILAYENNKHKECINLPAPIKSLH